MPRCSHPLGLLALCMAGLLATPAAAQTASAPRKQPTQQELAQAREHFKAAEAAKRRHDYKAAVDRYLAAYELFPDPEFFFNVAEAYRLAGDVASSLTYYQKYLELDPGGRGAPAARAAIEELQRTTRAEPAPRRDAELDANGKADEAAARRKGEIDARRLAEADAVWHVLEHEPARNAAEAAAQPRPVEDAPPTSAAAARAATATEAAAVPSIGDAMRPPEAPAGQRLRIAGLATGGAGVIALGIGVAFGLHARSISDETAQWEMFHQARFDEGQAAERNMYILTGVGAAALLTGGVLYYLGHRADSEAVTIVPVVSPGAATLTAVRRF